MNNKKIYLYMQRFFSKIIVKPFNPVTKGLDVYLDQKVLTSALTKVGTLVKADVKTKGLDQSQYLGQDQRVLTKGLTKSHNQINFSKNFYNSSLTLLKSHSRVQISTSKDPKLIFVVLVFKQTQHCLLLTTTKLVVPVFFFTYSGKRVMLTSSDLLHRGSRAENPNGFFSSTKNKRYSYNIIKKLQFLENFIQIVVLNFFDVGFIRYRQVFEKSLVQNLLYKPFPKTIDQGSLNHSFLKTTKNVTFGHWYRYKKQNKNKISLKSFYFVFFAFLKSDNQNMGFSRMLDLLATSEYLNHPPLILLKLYRICKFYKQSQRTQIFVNQKLYNNLQFLNPHFNICFLRLNFFKIKPFINHNSFLQIKSFNSSYFQIARPLLSITRLDTFYLSESFKLPIYPDKTNLQVHFLRNRVRRQILPAIRILVNPQFDTILCNFSESHLVTKNINLV